MQVPTPDVQVELCLRGNIYLINIAGDSDVAAPWHPL